jgi:hypothetical protein
MMQHIQRWRDIVNVKNVTTTLAARQFESPPFSVRELDFENASDSSSHVVVEDVGVL